jgi:hypothetical protein
MNDSKEHKRQEETMSGDPPQVPQTVKRALRSVYAWWQDVYPDDVWDNERGDEGTTRVTRIRRELRAALKAAGMKP